MSRIHLRGGSILRTSRANPTKADADLDRCADVLIREGIDYLLAIGGDDTAYSAYRVARHAQETRHVAIQVAHVPKTIDNDLPLPDDIRTFGYETARELGTKTVMNLMEEALTGRRWILVVTMGRKTGHLALGIGKSAGATVTLIPEEWGEQPIRLQEVLDILATSIIKRLAEGKDYGVAVIAEGLVEQMATGGPRSPQGRAARQPRPHPVVRDQLLRRPEERAAPHPQGGRHQPAPDQQGSGLRAAVRRPDRLRHRLHDRSGRSCCELSAGGRLERDDHDTTKPGRADPIRKHDGPAHRAHRGAPCQDRLLRLSFRLQVHDPAEAAERVRRRAPGAHGRTHQPVARSLQSTLRLSDRDRAHGRFDAKCGTHVGTLAR